MGRPARLTNLTRSAIIYGNHKIRRSKKMMKIKVFRSLFENISIPFNHTYIINTMRLFGPLKIWCAPHRYSI